MIRLNRENKNFSEKYQSLVDKGWVIARMEGPNFVLEKQSKPEIKPEPKPIVKSTNPDLILLKVTEKRLVEDKKLSSSSVKRLEKKVKILKAKLSL